MAEHPGKHQDTPEEVTKHAQDSAHLLEQGNIQEFRQSMEKGLQSLGDEGRKLFFDKLQTTVASDKATNQALPDIQITEHEAGNGTVRDISLNVNGRMKTVLEVAGANSKVIAGANEASANVIAEPGSHVIAKAGTVTALDGAELTAVGSQGLIGEDSIATSYTQVRAKEGSHVHALSNTNVIAEKGATVEAERGSQVKAEKGSTIIYSPGAEIQAPAGTLLVKASDIPHKDKPRRKGG
jgi:hypothetical protein